MLGFDGDAAFALRPHSVTTPGPQGKHEDTSVGSVDVSVRSTPPPSLQGLRRGCLEVRAFWKQSCPVRFHITVCVSPRAHRITPRHMCEAGEIESSQVSGFSNSQLVFWMAASRPGPPLPAANQSSRICPFHRNLLSAPQTFPLLEGPVPSTADSYTGILDPPFHCSSLQSSETLFSSSKTH